MDETAAEHDVIRRILEACLERAPRPEPTWETEAARHGHMSGAAVALRSRSSPTGVSPACSSAPTAVHGGGKATRSRVRGRIVRATAGRGSTGVRRPSCRRHAAGDEFVVREFFAEQAPRVAVVVDRGSRMALYADPCPWLDKQAALDDGVAADRAGDRGGTRRAGVRRS